MDTAQQKRSVLQSSVLQCVAVCCSVLQCVVLWHLYGGTKESQCVAVCCNVLGVLERVAVCCTVTYIPRNKRASLGWRFLDASSSCASSSCVPGCLPSTSSSSKSSVSIEACHTYQCFDPWNWGPFIRDYACNTLQLQHTYPCFDATIPCQLWGGYDE